MLLLEGRLFAQDHPIHPAPNGWLALLESSLAYYSFEGNLLQQWTFESTDKLHPIQILDATLAKDNSTWFYILLKSDTNYHLGISKDLKAFQHWSVGETPIAHISAFEHGKSGIIQHTNGKFYRFSIDKDLEILSLQTSFPTNILFWNTFAEQQLLLFYEDGSIQRASINVNNTVILEQSSSKSKLKLKQIIPIAGTSSYWAVDSKSRLYLYRSDGGYIPISSLKGEMLAATDSGLLLTRNNGRIALQHPFVSRLSQELPINFANEVYLNASSLLVSTPDGWVFDAKSVHEAENWILDQIRFQPRILTEEITNQLSKLGLDLNDWSSPEYLRQKALIREAAKAYVQALGLSTPVEGMSAMISSLKQEKITEDIGLASIYWEDENLNAQLGANESLILELQLDAKPTTDPTSWPFTPLKVLDVQQGNDGQTYTITLQAPASLPKEEEWRIELPFKNTEPVRIPIDVSTEARITHVFYESLKDAEGRPQEIILQCSFVNADASTLNAFIQDNGWQLATKKNEKSPNILTFSFSTHRLSTATTSYPWKIVANGKILASGIINIEQQLSLLKEADDKQLQTHPLLALPEQAAHKDDSTLVVLIGNRNYEHAPEASYAIRDIQFVETYAQRLLGIPESHIIRIQNAKLSDWVYYFGQENRSGRITELAGNRFKRIMFYYSGHGMPSLDGLDAYLLPTDARLEKAESTAIARSALLEKIRLLPFEESIVIFESCFSGLTGNGDNLLPNSSASIGIQLHNPLLAKENSAVFSAAGPNQLANWLPSYGCSMYTYHLLEAWKKIAVKEHPNSIESLQQLLQDENGVEGEAARIYGRKQVPQLQTNAFELPLFRVKN